MLDLNRPSQPRLSDLALELRQSDCAGLGGEVGTNRVTDKNLLLSKPLRFSVIVPPYHYQLALNSGTAAFEHVV